MNILDEIMQYDYDDQGNDIFTKDSVTVYFSRFLLIRLEIKPCGLGSRIRDVEAFWYKTEMKIIYFVPLCLIVLIVSDCMVYPNPKFLIFKKYQKINLGSG